MDPCKKNELGVSEVDAARYVLDLTVSLRDAIVAAGGRPETVSDVFDEHAKRALKHFARNGVRLQVETKEPARTGEAFALEEQREKDLKRARELREDARDLRRKAYTYSRAQARLDAIAGNIERKYR